MIGITGASGKLGRLVIEEIISNGERPEDIIALVRSPEKVQDLKERGINIKVADYDLPASLNQAIQEVEKLLLISGSEVGRRIEQHRAVVNAAIKNKIKFIAYTSLLSADKSPLPIAKEHLETEKLIKTSGIPYTILRNGWYTENYLMAIRQVLESGKMYGCAKGAKFSTASRRDFAKAAANVLTSDGHQGKTYELAGDHSFTLSEFASCLSKVSKKPVTYIDMSEKEYFELLVQIGFPLPFAKMLAETETLAQDGWLFNESHELSRLIGRKPETLSETIENHI